MIYLQHINLTLVATTAYPKNMENYRELTEQEYLELLYAEPPVEEAEATEEDYLEALAELGVE